MLHICTSFWKNFVRKYSTYDSTLLHKKYSLVDTFLVVSWLLFVPVITRSSKISPVRMSFSSSTVSRFFHCSRLLRLMASCSYRTYSSKSHLHLVFVVKFRCWSIPKISNQADWILLYPHWSNQNSALVIKWSLGWKLSILHEAWSGALGKMF